jgi:hypothetical protein
MSHDISKQVSIVVTLVFRRCLVGMSAVSPFIFFGTSRQMAGYCSRYVSLASIQNLYN